MPSAADVIRPAFQHTTQQLFKPFRFGQWVRLAITGLLAGELSGAGGCSFQAPWRPRGQDGSASFLAQAAPAGVLLFAGIAMLIVLGVVLLVALIYVSSMMRFVLFNSVVAKECAVRRYWVQSRGPGFRYFLFQLLFALTMFTGLALLIGTAAALGFGFGWFRNPRQFLLPLILFGIAFFLVFAAFIITALVVTVLTRDFVVPQMALEDLSVTEAWRRLAAMLKTETAGYAGYIGLKIVLSIAAAVAMGIAIVVFVIVLLIPVALVALIVVFGGGALGLVWNIYTTSLAIVAACIVAAAILFGILLISVPLIVFFPAYSVYFLAARYPALSRLLFPSPGAAPSSP
jgi:hypothetical protein